MFVNSNSALVTLKKGRYIRKKNRKKSAVFVHRRIYRSVLLLTQQYIELVQLRKRLRRRARRAKRRVLRLNKKITRDLRTMEVKYAHLRYRKKKKSNDAKLQKNKEVISSESEVMRTRRKRRREMRKYRMIRKRVNRRARRMRRINKARKRTKRNALRTMSKIKYFIRYVRERIENKHGAETSYATGNLLLTEHLLKKFLNLFMRDGKKHVIVKQFIKAVRYLKNEFKVHPVATFKRALIHDERLFFDYRVVRVGRHKTLIVPRILEGEQRILKPLRIIMDTVRNASIESDSILADVDKEKVEDVADGKEDAVIREGGITAKNNKKLRASAMRERGVADTAHNKKGSDHVNDTHFYKHLAHTMLYFVKNPDILPEKILELTQIAHDNKRNISRIVPMRIKKRGVRYSRNGLLWNWSKTRTYGGVESHYYKRALKPVPVRLGRRLYK